MTDTVVVTGGLGRSGRWLVDHLADEHRVVCVDRDHPGFDAEARPGVEFRAADLTDRGEALDVVRAADPDAVVHWAAIPHPLRHPEGRVFENNALAAHNVLTAAGAAGARIVQASSESTYGFPFREGRRLPEHAPVREAHPLRPEDPYGAAKVTAEELAGMVARRDGVSAVSLRASWIQFPGEYVVTDIDTEAGADNLWGYVDVRDVVAAVDAALAADVDGHEAVNVTAGDTFLDRPTRAAFEAAYGGVPDPCGLDGNETAYDLRKAADLLDWTPDHSWREAAEAAVAEPSLLAD
jgi:UDP-glucose 4-epimerase